jgi:hypothetical protein
VLGISWMFAPARLTTVSRELPKLESSVAVGVAGEQSGDVSGVRARV